MVEEDVELRLPELIPDWVLADWPAPLEPWDCSCLPSDPELAELAEPTLLDPELLEPEPVDPELADPEPVGSELVGWAIPGVSWQPVAAVPVGVTAAVRALRAAVAVVCAVDPVLLSAEQAMTDAEALQDLSQQLRVHGVRRLGDVTARELHTLRGFRSTAAWLRNTQPDADSSDAGLGRRLHGYARLSTAVQGGELSLVAARKVVLALGRCRPHVDQLDGRIDGQPGEQVITAVVAHVVDLVCGCVLGMNQDDPRLLDLQRTTQQIINSGPPLTAGPAGAGAGAGVGQLDRLEAAFVLLAEHVPPSLLTSCLEELVLAVLPSVLEDRAQRGRDNAGLSLQLNDDGSGWHLDGELDLQCGERLITALRSELGRDPANPLDTAAATDLRAHGINPWDPDTTATGSSAPGMNHAAGTDGVSGTSGDAGGTDPVGGTDPAGGTGDADRTDPAGGTDPAATSGDGPRAWPRSRRRRMHDALDALLRRYLEHGLGGTSQKTQYRSTSPSAQS